MEKGRFVKELISQLVEEHKKKFGFVGKKDAPKSYGLTYSPCQYDIDAWVRVLRRIQETKEFYKKLIRVITVLKDLGFNVVRWAYNNYDVTFEKDECELVVGIDYDFKERTIKLIPVSVEVTGDKEVAKEEINKLRSKKWEEMSIEDRLTYFVRFIEEEEKRVQEQINALKEEVDEELVREFFPNLH